MTVLMTAVQFTVSCLTLGMGLFLAAEAVREMSRIRFAPGAAGTPALVALGGAALLTAGLYGALLSVPL
jgi:hypothetical protein